jgi:hypothetical protein
MSIEIDDAIAQYREQLTAEAELARADIAEIEDHLRSLIDELQGIGMPAAEAIAEAARRLGDPRQLAREHARVRTPFGAKLSFAGALSTTLLSLPLLCVDVRMLIVQGLSVLTVFQLIALLIVVAGLAFRQAWGRAIVLGFLADATVNLAYYAAVVPQHSVLAVAQLVFTLGALAVVAPWRWSQLTRLGWALVLLGPAYHGAILLLGLVPFGVLGATAILGVVAAGAGALLQARWAAVSAAVASVLLASGIAVCRNMIAVGPHPMLTRVYVFGTLTVAVLAALCIALLSWRSARGVLGTLRGVIS